MPKNVLTTAQLHSSHMASKVMLKILQARLQHYVNRELPGIQAAFRKGRGARDQIANIRWIMEKATPGVVMDREAWRAAIHGVAMKTDLFQSRGHC